MSFRLLSATAILFAAAALAFTAPAAKAEEMTKEQVEKIVHEYLMSHGDVILKSVDEFQRRDVQTRQADALKRNRAELFQNERSPFVGKIDGDVTIVEFFDYNCGYCKRAFKDLKGLIDSDKNVKVILKDFPILGPTSELASRWALAAHKQDKYFEFHARMMEHTGPITLESLEKTAKSLGLDVAKMKKDSAQTEITIQLEKNRSLAGQLGLNGTPAFIIGDEVVPGALPKSEIEQKVKAARSAKSGAKDVPKDAPAADPAKPADDAGQTP